MNISSLYPNIMPRIVDEDIFHSDPVMSEAEELDLLEAEHERSCAEIINMDSDTIPPGSLLEETERDDESLDDEGSTGSHDAMFLHMFHNLENLPLNPFIENAIEEPDDQIMDNVIVDHRHEHEDRSPLVDSIFNIMPPNLE